MARRFRDRMKSCGCAAPCNCNDTGEWSYGGAPAQGGTHHPQADSGDVASNFLAGVDNATDDPIKQYQVPNLNGSSIRGDVSPGVWGPSSKRP